MTKKLNRAKCKNCGDIIVSRHHYDWVACSCYSHNTGIFIDGGNDYWRYGGNFSHLLRYENRKWVPINDVLKKNESSVIVDKEQINTIGKEVFDNFSFDLFPSVIIVSKKVYNWIKGKIGHGS